MTGELRARTLEIQQAVQGTWTLDGRDVERPNPESLVKKLIEESRVEIQPRLENEFFGCGPLTEILTDEDVTEVVVNGHQEIWFERHGRFERLDDQFSSEELFKTFVDRLAAECQVQIDLARPFANGRWRDFRVHMTLAPIAHCSFHLTLRRTAREPWTLKRLADGHFLSSPQIDALHGLLKNRKNILFVGGTGSGKTSLLGACLLELPSSERVVILEDTNELPRPNDASTKLLVRPAVPPLLGEVQLADLVKESLRMRPNRLVVGEVRGGEAKDLLMALATGHSGSLGTLHASDPRQALLRLEMLVQMGAPEWPTDAIRQLIKLSVDAICVCEIKNGHRRLEGLYAVAALESFGFIFEPIL